MNQLLEGKDSGEPRCESFPKEEKFCSLRASWVVSQLGYNREWLRGAVVELA